jgi:hypothetical protein
MMRTRILITLLTLAVAGSSFSKDLTFSIRATPQSVKIGDRVTFTFLYTNTSKHEIGIVPEYYAYEALDVHLKKSDTHQVGEMIPYLSPYIDPNLAKRNFRLVSPGKTYSRQVVATFSTTMPKPTRSVGPGPGLYLVFRDSAIKLPGFGQYEATSRYLGVKSYREQVTTRDKNRLWIGKVFASPITISFESR